jgi:U3 small nucleolar RNA-associated protein 16
VDEKRKLQAKASSKKTKEPWVGSRKFEQKSPQDDTVSESTATLQGSVSKESGRLALPALLPEEILNAEPVTRPPTPPPESGDQRKRPQKLKFLDKVEKPPKDLHLGDVTIRVLEDYSSGKKTTPTLPPKMSKAGRNIREAWMSGQRNKNSINGLKRTAGGPSSFVRSR